MYRHSNGHEVCVRRHSQQGRREHPRDEGEEAGDGEDIELVSDGVVENLERLHVPLQLEHANKPARAYLTG